MTNRGTEQSTEFLIGITETINVGDAIARVASFPRGAADTLTIADGVGRFTNRPVPLAETVSVTDALARSVNYDRELAELLTLADQIQALIAAHLRGLAWADSSKGRGRALPADIHAPRGTTSVVKARARAEYQ